MEGYWKVKVWLDGYFERQGLVGGLWLWWTVEGRFVVFGKVRK